MSSSSPNPQKTVAIATTGRVNPAIAPLIAHLLVRYRDIAKSSVKVICYLNGFRGILCGHSVTITDQHVDAAATTFIGKGGNPIGSSRVRLSNKEHLLKSGIISPSPPDEKTFDPYLVCAERLRDDGVDVLHVIGSTHALLCAHQISVTSAKQLGRKLTCVSIPKTIEGYVLPLAQTLGLHSGAVGSARFFENVVSEFSASPRSLILHEIKGRQAGVLTAAAAREYRERLQRQEFANDATLNVSRDRRDIHAIYIPEMTVAWESEIARLRGVMERVGNVNIFVSQGYAFAEDTVLPPQEKHPTLGYTLTQPAQWLAKKLAGAIGAHKTLIQKSGIVVRGGVASREDQVLAQSIAASAVECAIADRAGVIGHDRERGNRLRAIEIERIKQGKMCFDLSTPWFREMLQQIGQPLPGNNNNNVAQLSKL